MKKKPEKRNPLTEKLSSRLAKQSLLALAEKTKSLAEKIEGYYVMDSIYVLQTLKNQLEEIQNQFLDTYLIEKAQFNKGGKSENEQ